MKLQNTKLGFTLIELLVVITIIGILATGAVSVYTSQIQKARDSVRLTDVNALKWSIEQSYQDISEYPGSDTFFTDVSVYLEKFPKDPKHGQPCNDWWNPVNASDCAYSYIVWPDNNGILFGEFEVSTSFENAGNVSQKAALDWGWTWVELTRLELWIDISTNNSWVPLDSVTEGPWACGLDWNVASSDTQLIIINWNPTSGAQCD